MVDEIKDYRPDEYGQTPTEFLDGIKVEIETMADDLRTFKSDLEDWDSFYARLYKKRLCNQLTRYKTP